jgi:hypothetical protein
MLALDRIISYIVFGFFELLVKIEMLEEIVNFMKEQIKEQKRKKKGKK